MSTAPKNAPPANAAEEKAKALQASVPRARTFLTAGLFITLTSGHCRKILACPLRLQASSAASELNPMARTRNSEE